MKWTASQVRERIYFLRNQSRMIGGRIESLWLLAGTEADVSLWLEAWRETLQGIQECQDALRNENLLDPTEKFEWVPKHPVYRDDSVVGSIFLDAIPARTTGKTNNEKTS